MAWVTTRLHPMKKRLETVATEGRGGTVLQGREVTVHSPEKEDSGPEVARTWRRQNSVVQESGMASGVKWELLKKESVQRAEML